MTSHLYGYLSVESKLIPYLTHHNVHAGTGEPAAYYKFTQARVEYGKI